MRRRSGSKVMAQLLCRLRPPHLFQSEAFTAAATRVVTAPRVDSCGSGASFMNVTRIRASSSSSRAPTSCARTRRCVAVQRGRRPRRAVPAGKRAAAIQRHRQSRCTRAQAGSGRLSRVIRTSRVRRGDGQRSRASAPPAPAGLAHFATHRGEFAATEPPKHGTLPTFVVTVPVPEGRFGTAIGRWAQGDGGTVCTHQALLS